MLSQLYCLTINLSYQLGMITSSSNLLYFSGFVWGNPSRLLYPTDSSGLRRTWRKPLTNHKLITDKLYHIRLYRVHLTWTGFKLTTLVVIGTDCIGSYISNICNWNIVESGLKHHNPNPICWSRLTDLTFVYKQD
jgi:hypothetical protein